NLRPLELHFTGVPFPTKQTSELELDPELVNPQRQRLAPARYLDVFEEHGGRRQQSNLDRPADAHLQAGKTTRLKLEFGPIAVPIDKMRTDQRCGERDNEDNRDTKKRVLHAVARSDFPARWLAGAGPGKSPRRHHEHDSAAAPRG